MSFIINIFDSGKKKKHRRAHSFRLKSFGPVSDQSPSQRLRPSGPVSVHRHLGPPSEGELMGIVLGDSQQSVVSYGGATDKKGQPATVQPGSLEWISSDPNVATGVTITEDPPSAAVIAGNPGVCEMWPSADANLGDGVTTITGEKFSVQVTAGEASAFGAPVFGETTEQP